MKQLIPILLLCAASAQAQLAFSLTDPVMLTSGGGGGGGIGTTGLVAWFDFADATDSHGSYDLTEVGTPTYTPGTPNYGTGTNEGVDKWDTSVNSLDEQICHSYVDQAFALRFRPVSGDVDNGDYALQGNFSRFRVRYLTSTATVELMDIVVSTAAMSAGTWYTVVGSYDSATSTLTVWLNGTQYSNTGTPLAGSTGTISLPLDGGFDVDFFATWQRELTSVEADWIYNSGSTRSYSDL